MDHNRNGLLGGPSGVVQADGIATRAVRGKGKGVLLLPVGRVNDRLGRVGHPDVDGVVVEDLQLGAKLGRVWVAWVQVFDNAELLVRSNGHNFRQCER